MSKDKMKVSVVMAVYNRENLVKECITSIQDQNFNDFEIIVVDDYSEDSTYDVLESLAKDDKRIRLFRNHRHHFIETLNIGMSEANGEYIARIDSDDIMLPDRLRKQVECMDDDLSLSVCCSWYETFGSYQSLQNNIVGKVKRPYYQFLLGNYLANPTSMIRKSFLEEHHLYYQNDYIYSEDYKMWTEIAKYGGGFYVIPEVLTKYRIHDKQLSIKHREIQANSAFKAQTDVLNDLLEIESQKDPNIEPLFTILSYYNEKEMLSMESICRVCYEILENRNRLSNKK